MYTCPKCRGTGRVPFPHIANGRCFDCNGQGRVKTIPNVKRLEWLKEKFKKIETEYQKMEAESQTYSNRLLEAINHKDHKSIKTINEELKEFNPRYEKIKEKYMSFQKTIEREEKAIQQL